MRRAAPILFGRAVALCTLCAGTAVAAVPPVKAAPERLTLENAAPLPVPPRPNLGSQKPVKAPPRFVTPVPMTAPPLPDLIEGAAQRTAPAPGKAPAPAATPAPPPAVAAAPPVPATPPSPVSPAPSRTETAALPPPPDAAPPAASATPSAVLSLVFDGAATNLPDAADETVDRIVQRLRASDTARLQLRSYATGTSETAREARQLSLARALSLRERLTAFGVRSSRIDVRALGIDTGSGGTPDRIDVEFLNE
ncbi:outer membrane protein OmpA-like peptidoglycan-associated protein [Azospirillum agricola]|uniref:OmpA family protein n=1 Tax=Azospirillum agricola TaxID=1720247 RepID=UPI001AE37C5C|nr:OmpA family protein [Azospirillum agricola]MBP2227002.1 outer membrane protein OmpA-like peptidoglycan-associated protein [Azospirillum agricola]